MEAEFKEKLDSLYRITTLVYIKNKSNLIVGNDLYEWENHPQQLHSKEPKHFEDLTKEWEIIWRSFGDYWNHERQLFRYFWEECRCFFQSYNLYRANHSKFLQTCFSEDVDDRELRDILSLNAELAIKSMYEYGRQSLILLKKLETLISTKVNPNIAFSEKFKETRNKFLNHYHDPASYSEFIFDPVLSSVMGTGSCLEIRVHLPQTKEHIYTVYVNHLDDYFRLEEVLWVSIERLAELKKILLKK